jgi:hypothetical protein
MTRLSAFAALGAAALLAACASSGGNPEPETFDPELALACIDIDNRQGGAGTMEQVYLVDADRRPKEGISGIYTGYDRMGDGIRLGEARLGRVTRFCTQSVQLPGRYFLRVQIASADNFDPATQNQAPGWAASRSPRTIETDDVVMEPGDLWIWDVRRDRWDCRPNAAYGGGDC